MAAVSCQLFRVIAQEAFFLFSFPTYYARGVQKKKIFRAPVIFDRDRSFRKDRIFRLRSVPNSSQAFGPHGSNQPHIRRSTKSLDIDWSVSFIIKPNSQRKLQKWPTVALLLLSKLTQQKGTGKFGSVSHERADFMHWCPCLYVTSAAFPSVCLLPLFDTNIV